MHVAFFRAMLGDEDEAVAMESASKDLLALLLKLSKWKERVSDKSKNSSKQAAPQATNVDTKINKQVQLPKTEVTAQKAKVLPLLQEPASKVEVAKVVQQPKSQQQANNKQPPAQQPKPPQQKQPNKPNPQPAKQSLPSSLSSNEGLKGNGKVTGYTKKQIFNENKSQPTTFKGKAWKNAQANNSKKDFLYKKKKNGSTTNLSIASTTKSHSKATASKQSKEQSPSSTSFLSSNFGSQDELGEPSTRILESTGKLDEEAEARRLIPEIVQLIALYNNALGKLIIIMIIII